MAIQSDLVIDIGLHKGEDPDLVRECRARFARELSAQRLRIIEGAIAEGGPKVSFYNDDNSVWGTVHQDWAKRNEKLSSHNRLIEVGVLDVSRIFNDVGIPYYLKLDIESSEHLVLTAMLTLHDAPPFLSMESEKVSFKKLLWELRTLRKLGYRRFRVVQQQSIAGTTIQTVDLAGRYQACLKYVWIFGQAVWRQRSDAETLARAPVTPSPDAHHRAQPFPGGTTPTRRSLRRASALRSAT